MEYWKALRRGARKCQGLDDSDKEYKPSPFGCCDTGPREEFPDEKRRAAIAAGIYVGP